MMFDEQNREGRGFAGMDEEKRREIASKGGQAAHAKGTAHEFTSEEAREAGRKGGQARSNAMNSGMHSADMSSSMDAGDMSAETNAGEGEENR